MAATFVVEDGTGLSNANSYTSVAYSTQYHENHGNPSAWSAATQANKEAALRLATQYLDAVYHDRWQGQRVNATMALDWPRYQVTDADGFWVPSNAVPAQVQDATCYLALRQIGGDTLLPDDASGTNIAAESVTVGPITTSTTYSGSKGGTRYYRIVERLVSELTGGPGGVYRA